MTTPKANPAAALLQIDGDMTIYRAAELKQLLLDALRKTEALTVDLSAVTELDSAGVQLLMLARRTAGDERRALHLTGHSPAVQEVFTLLDLPDYFRQPPGLPAVPGGAE